MPIHASSGCDSFLDNLKLPVFYQWVREVDWHLYTGLFTESVDKGRQYPILVMKRWIQKCAVSMRSSKLDWTVLSKLRRRRRIAES